MEYYSDIWTELLSQLNPKAHAIDNSEDWDNDEQTSLHDSVINEDVKIVRKLLKHGARINGFDRQGLTPLHYAVMKQNEKLVRLLLSHGAQVNCQVSQVGLTPLHMMSMRQDNCQILLLLIEYGADVNAEDDKKDTPLHFACRYSVDKKSRILLDAGADINAMNNNGQTPLDMAFEKLDFIPRSLKQQFTRIFAQQVLNALMEHLTKIYVAEFFLTESNKKYINMCKNEFVKRCRHELYFMSQTTLHKQFTLYDVFVGNMRTLAKFDSEEEAKAILSRDYSDTLPIYGQWLSKKIVTLELSYECEKTSFSIPGLSGFAPPDQCIEVICDNLDSEDLNSLQIAANIDTKMNA